MLLSKFQRSSAAQFLHQQKHSVDTDDVLAVEDPLPGDVNTVTVSNVASSPSTSFQVSPTELDTKEHEAAIVIQSAYRAFLVFYSSISYLPVKKPTCHPTHVIVEPTTYLQINWHDFCNGQSSIMSIFCIHFFVGSMWFEN
jgi:hypothetical protein